MDSLFIRRAFLPVVASVFFQANASADTIDVPVFSQCDTELTQSNTRDSQVYNLYSDFYYEYNDPREYALVALEKLTSQFAASNSICQQYTQASLDDIHCEAQIGGTEICSLESDTGDFVIVKDYVDASNIILSKHNDDIWPAIHSENDNAPLYVPNPGSCYDGLLQGGMDSQAYLVDASSYRYFGDFRYVLARTTRDTVKEIANRNDYCYYQTTAESAANMQCSILSSGTQYCSLPNTNAGYFVFVTGEDHSMHLIFNRWD
ncbi:hypothetical protein [Shewanella surugensis]|uniref:Uncharacterized protein n=1 Tax=Shewanella surugensis TaxID=212020 RepID=A0ABT0LE67_9GAMM|nr:hypothetical protein [Shewanella surugensis]MCL1126001.1 hypothetical protein [Shewanella surugensis]